MNVLELALNLFRSRKYQQSLRRLKSLGNKIMLWMRYVLDSQSLFFTHVWCLQNMREFVNEWRKQNNGDDVLMKFNWKNTGSAWSYGAWSFIFRSQKSTEHDQNDEATISHSSSHSRFHLHVAFALLFCIRRWKYKDKNRNEREWFCKLVN